MKRKLRRIFQKAAPNVLDRVMDACVPSEEAVKPAKKKTVKWAKYREFAATAAAIALVIAMGGGLIWFVGTGGVGMSNSSTGGVPLSSQPTFYDPDDLVTPPPDGTEAVDPDATVGPPISAIIGGYEAGRLALEEMFFGSDLVLEGFAGQWTVDMVTRADASCYKITLFYNCAYHVYYYTLTGDLLDVEVTRYDVISEMDARDIAFAEIGTTPNDVNFLNITLDWDKMQYVMEIWAADGWYDVRLDGRTGEILLNNKTEMTMEPDWQERAGLLSWREAVELAAQEYGDVVQRIGRLKVSVSGSVAEPYYEISISFLEDPWFFYMHVEADTGKITNQSFPGSSSVPVDPEPPMGILSAEEVLTIAAMEVPKEVRVALGAGVSGYTCKAELKNLSGTPYYETIITAEHYVWRFLQDCTTGELLEIPVPEEKLPFSARYIHSPGIVEAEDAVITVIRSVEDLRFYGLEETYDEAFFRDHTLLRILKNEQYADGYFRITHVYKTADGSWEIGIGTRSYHEEDSGQWYSWAAFVEVNEILPENAMIHLNENAGWHLVFTHDEKTVPVPAQERVLASLLADIGDGEIQWCYRLNENGTLSETQATIEYNGLVYEWTVANHADENGDLFADFVTIDTENGWQTYYWDPIQGGYHRTEP